MDTQSNNLFEDKIHHIAKQLRILEHNGYGTMSITIYDGKISDIDVSLRIRLTDVQNIGKMIVTVS